MMKLVALAFVATMVAVGCSAQDLTTLHDNALSLEQSALDNRYTVAGLEISAQLAATQDDVDNLASEVSSLRDTLSSKGSRATFEVLQETTDRAFTAVNSALDGITSAAGAVPAAELEVNMVVSQVSAINQLYQFTQDRVNAIDENLSTLIEEGESILEEGGTFYEDQAANVGDAFTALSMKASQLDAALGSFDFDSYKMTLSNLKRQGILDPKRPVYRYNVFSLYGSAHGVYFGNNDASLYGGVTPSNWGNGATANSVSANKDVQRNFFIFKGYGGKNANVWAEEWYHSSGTNSRVCAVMFRIKNTTPDEITWTTSYYYSSYGGYTDHSSVAVNGELAWSSSSNCGFCNVSRDLVIPAGQTSSVVFIINSGPPSSNMRTLLLIFHTDSLELPDGLEYVDDLDYAMGGYDQ